MNRREFTRSQKFEIIKRATKDGQITCEGCGFVLGGKRFEIDHTLPEALVADKSRELTIEDGKLLGKACCHSPKTADDVRRIRKADRQGFGHRIRKRSTFACSRDSRFKKKLSGEVVLR